MCVGTGGVLEVKTPFSLQKPKETCLGGLIYFCSSYLV